MSKSALVLTWDQFQDQEVVYPYHRLLGAGFETDLSAESPGVIHGIQGVKMNATISYKDIHKHDYGLLVLPGGVKSLEKVRQEQSVLDFIHEWNKQGKLIASICHGAQLLISSKVVSGRKISGYYSIKDDITNAGATYVDDRFVIDDNIISSPHYDHMGVWLEKALDLYNERESV